MLKPGEPALKPSDALVVSPLASARWVAGRLEISAAGAPVRLMTSEVDAVAVLHAFARARTILEVQAGLPAIRPDDLIAAVSGFRAADVLLPPAVAAELTSGHWDSESLAFHRRSRAARATGVPPRSPPVPPLRSGAVIKLGREPDNAPRDFRSVLGARSSRRTWRAVPMPNCELGEFLWLSARNRAGGNAADALSRPYPSGGAAYSLELYPVLAPRSVAGIAPGMYQYRPDAHALETVSARPGDCAPLLAEGAAALGAASRPPVTIVVTSRFERASSSYGELAYSLVLSEAGGLIQTMYLVAEYLGLAACAIGGGLRDGFIGEMIGAPDLIEPVVGALAIGLRAG